MLKDDRVAVHEPTLHPSTIIIFSFFSFMTKLIIFCFFRLWRIDHWQIALAHFWLRWPRNCSQIMARLFCDCGRCCFPRRCVGPRPLPWVQAWIGYFVRMWWIGKCSVPCLGQQDWCSPSCIGRWTTCGVGLVRDIRERSPRWTWGEHPSHWVVHVFRCAAYGVCRWIPLDGPISIRHNNARISNFKKTIRKFISHSTMHPFRPLYNECPPYVNFVIISSTASLPFPRTSFVVTMQGPLNTWESYRSFSRPAKVGRVHLRSIRSYRACGTSHVVSTSYLNLFSVCYTSLQFQMWWSMLALPHICKRGVPTCHISLRDRCFLSTSSRRL